MDFKSQATVLNQFLYDTQILWRHEVMNTYPDSLNHFKASWIGELKKLTLDELFLIDSKQSFDSLADSKLKEFLEQIKTMTRIPFIEENKESLLEDWAYIDIKHKKRHEILKIAPLIKQLFANKKFSFVNDIGGGVGHLARILAHYHQIPTNSIDQNNDFQKIGIERCKRFRKLENAKEVNFINASFGKDHTYDQKLFTKDSFSIGLHTCGGLAPELIKTNINNSTAGLLSFGCCYFKITDERDLNLSTFYKNQNFLTLNPFGLTLATRSHAETNFENFKTRIQVKKYRYSLHLFLIEHFNIHDAIDIGECPVKIYHEPIANYILLKLKDLKIKHHFSSQDIENFYQQNSIQEKLEHMFLCDIIRWQIGRVLEIYLIIDRCLYLEENGFEVELKQYFKEALSPRNLGILALKKLS